MKRILIGCTLSLIISLSCSGGAEAGELHEGNQQEKQQFSNVSVLTRVLPETYECSLQPRFGYFWHCSTCDYESCWHIFSSSATAFARSHMRTHENHQCMVYEG